MRRWAVVGAGKRGFEMVRVQRGRGQRRSTRDTSARRAGSVSVGKERDLSEVAMEKEVYNVRLGIRLGQRQALPRYLLQHLGVR